MLPEEYQVTAIGNMHSKFGEAGLCRSEGMHNFSLHHITLYLIPIHKAKNIYVQICVEECIQYLSIIRTSKLPGTSLIGK